MKNACAKRAKILFFIVKYANLWGFCCRRRRGCLSFLILFFNSIVKGRDVFDFLCNVTCSESLMAQHQGRGLPFGALQKEMPGK